MKSANSSRHWTFLVFCPAFIINLFFLKSMALIIADVMALQKQVARVTGVIPRVGGLQRVICLDL